MEGRTHAEESTAGISSYGRFARRPEELSLDDVAAADQRNPSAANEEARSSGEDSSGSSSEDEDSIYGEHSDRLWRNPHELSQHAISNAGGSSDLGVARRKLSSVGSSEAAERVIVEDYVLGARAEENLAHFSSREREFGSAASLSAEDVDAMAMPRRRKSGIDRSRGIDEISNLSAHINKKRSASPAAASVATVYSHHEAGAPEQAQGKTSHQTSVRGHRMKVKSELTDGATENTRERRAASKTGDHHQHNNASASLSSSKTTTYMSSGLSSSSGVLTGGGLSSSSSSSSAASASREHEHEFRAAGDEAGGAAGAAAGATTVTTGTEGATNVHSTTRAGVVPPLELPLHKAGAWMQSSAQLRAFHVGGAAPEGTSHLAHLNTSFYHHAARNSNHKKNRSASFDSSVCTTGLNPRVGRRPPRGAAGRQPEDRWDEQQHHLQHAVFTSTTGPSSGQRRRVDMTGVSQQHAFSFKNTEGTNSGIAGQAEGGQAARGSHPRQESRFRMPRASSKDPIEGRGVNIGGAVNYQPRRRIRSSERWLRRVLSQDSRSLLPLHPQALQNLSPATKKRHRENGQEFFREKSTAADDSLSSSDNSSDSDSDSEESPTSSSDYHSDAVVGKSPQKKKPGGKSERIKKGHQQFQAPPRFLCCPNQDCLITLKQALQQFTTR